MCFRIVVHAAEAWLMADRRAFARALGVEEKYVPSDPETLIRPKSSIVDLARKSRVAEIRRELVPDPRSGLEGGPALGAWLSGFADRLWSPERAADSGRAPSLSKALKRIEELIRRSG
ncbi:hypothetical protein [Rhodoplanes azumiensis]|uniref:Uncharacterized protein n=1 Tax=Rhodoplanes azumiensis TaxID=1897628 RepID=A0ABW5AQ72_9BRAD